MNRSFSSHMQSALCEAAICQMQALVSLRLYITSRALKGLWVTGAAWHPVWKDNSSTSLALLDEESDCQSLDGHAFDVIYLLAFTSTGWAG